MVHTHVHWGSTARDANLHSVGSMLRESSFVSLDMQHQPLHWMYLGYIAMG
jgi:hypothetical protein